VNNLPKVVTQLCPEQDLNPRPVDRKSNALLVKSVFVCICLRVCVICWLNVVALLHWYLV